MQEEANFNLNQEKEREIMGKVTKIDKEDAVKETREKITFTNGMLQQFTVDRSLMKIIASPLNPGDKFKLYELSMKVLKSPEMEAYVKTKNEIVEQFMKDEEKKVKAQTKKDLENADSKDVTDSPRDEPKKDEAGMPVDHPDIIALFKQETTLTVIKPRIKASDLDKSIVVADMIQLSWLIKFLQ